MKKALMIIAIIGIVVIAGSILYYFVFFRAEQERAQIKLEQNNKADLTNALAELEAWYKDSKVQAYKDYSDQWEEVCKTQGVKFISPDKSPISKDQADSLNGYYYGDLNRIAEEYQSKKDALFKLYK